MATNSFRKSQGLPPSEYRTPSPPLHYVEPLSPGTAAWSNSWSTPLQSQRINKPIAIDGTNYHTSRKSVRNLKEVGQDNVMEDFASIALSANGDQLQPQRFVVHTWDHQKPNSTPEDMDERPSKRVRSEKAVSQDWHYLDPRSNTSQFPLSDAQRLEAELLLNFSREACVAASMITIQPPSPHSTNSLSQNSQSGLKLVNSSEPSRNVDSGSYDNKGCAWHSEHGAVDAVEVDLQIERRDTKLRGSHHSHIMPIGARVCEPIINFEESMGQIKNEPIMGGQKEQGNNTGGQVDGKESESQGIGFHTEREVSQTLAQQPTEDHSLGQAEQSGHHLTAGNSFLLSGIEEAARADTNGLPDTFMEPKDLHEVPKLPAKQKDSDSPSVCAACNFFRNALTLETEIGATSWISCDGCKSWFHFACAGFKNEREVRGVDKFRCRKCKAVHGPTTYVRKSARAHSAIDYAGLNEGIVKTSDENPEHHYIKPIKEGTIKFDQEAFARMRPELVTADFFEKGDGMKEPIVIPAAFNPRTRHIEDPSQQDTTSSIMTDANDTTIPFDSSVLESWLSEGYEYQQVPDCGQDSLDMVIPLELTVRKVSELYGPEEKIEVIDVKSQNGEDKKWNMRRWVDYYESVGNKIVRNVISLEVSQSKLGHLIKRPKVVRDLDLQDSVWPSELLAKGEYPKVQFYCLMSVADCFTDFHIDFGGSSVYYHILKGKKTFFFIPPHEKHLKKYEEWCNSPAQNWTFLGDQTKECYRVDLSEGDTMLIPAGWIHAVWTPEDSLVIGGNFLTRMHYQMQIRVTQIEKATSVARKFRYPHFQKIMWYAALRYLEEDPTPDCVTGMLTSGRQFHREIPTYLDFDGWGENSTLGDENYQIRYYPKAELDGLPDLGRYLQRTALIAMGNITEGISVETRNAVKRSIPKGFGDPLEIVKRFAIWYTWKRGNENIPHWAYPDYVPEGGALELTEKKLSARTLKRLDREAALTAWRVAPDRQSTRSRIQPQTLLSEMVAGQSTPSQSKIGSPAPSAEPEISTRQISENPPADIPPEVSTPSAKTQKSATTSRPSGNRRPACEACRRGRRACKHRHDPVTLSDTPSTHILAEPFKEAGNPLIDLPAKGEGDAEQTSGLSKTTTNDGSDTPQMLNFEIVPSAPTFKQSTPENSTSRLSGDGEGLSSAQKASGRSKACKDCRKSKRRCVHDEFGNEDPVKLAEAAIPRPAAKKKKADGEWAQSPTTKKPKKQMGPDVKAETVASMGEIKPSVSNNSITERESQISQAQDHATVEVPSSAVSEGQDSEIQLGEDTPRQGEPSKAHVSNAEDEVNLISISPYPEAKYDPAVEQATLSPTTSNMKVQIASSLVSPPESRHADAEQTPPASAAARAVTPPVTSTSSRHSSRPAKTTAQRYTPESGTNRRTSISSEGHAVEIVDSGSPTMSVNAMGTLHKRTKSSRMSSEIAADEESLRLIRELQAQDMGLRRRGRV